MEKQPTIQDVLDVLSDFAGNVDQRFDRVEKRLEKIESTMVTKDQFTSLLDVLRENKVMSNYEVKQVKAIV